MLKDSNLHYQYTLPMNSRLYSSKNERFLKSISKAWRPEYKFSCGTLLQKTKIYNIHVYKYKDDDRMHTIDYLLYYHFLGWKSWLKKYHLKTISDLCTLDNKSFKDLSKIKGKGN